MQANRQALAQEIKEQILADLRQQNVGTMVGNQTLSPNEVDAIKRDVLMTLEAADVRQEVRENVNSALATASAYTDLAKSIKQDVLRELQMHQLTSVGSQHSNQALAESIKRDIIAELSGQSSTYRPQQFA